VTVNCYALEVTKNAQSSFKRTYQWTIDKSAAQTSLTLALNQSSPLNYSVTVNATSTQSDFAVSGAIAVHNPAPIPAKLNAVSDVVSEVGAATVNCGVSFPHTLAAGGTLNCTYNRSLPDTASRTNTATATLQNFNYSHDGSATASGATDFSGSAGVNFDNATVTDIDECATVSDTFAGLLGSVCAGVDTLPKTFPYSRTIGPFATCGDYSVENTASFETNDTQTTGSDNVSVDVQVPCAVAEGCTPGYWKQPHHFDSWAPTGYSPDQTLESVFDVPDTLGLDDKTLAEALGFRGGSGVKGAAQILLRAAVAALLNSAHPDVDYPRSTSAVIADVNTALASNNRSTILALAGALDVYNNLGCPLN
jgi:hypothetical protein